MRPVSSLLAAALVFAAAGVSIHGLPEPTGEPLITITGAFARPNAGDRVELDLTTLRSLDSVTVETTTDWDWHDGAPQRFRGPLLAPLLDSAGAEGDTVTVTGADGYSVTMTRADLERHGGLLARFINGDELIDPTFGPAWLVFDYDAIDDPAERKLYTERSVWSVIRIEIE